jgi:hypothetical protein
MLCGWFLRVEIIEIRLQRGTYIARAFLEQALAATACRNVYERDPSSQSWITAFRPPPTVRSEVSSLATNKDVFPCQSEQLSRFVQKVPQFQNSVGFSRNLMSWYRGSNLVRAKWVMRRAASSVIPRPMLAVLLRIVAFNLTIEDAADLTDLYLHRLDGELARNQSH